MSLAFWDTVYPTESQGAPRTKPISHPISLGAGRIRKTLGEGNHRSLWRFCFHLLIESRCLSRVLWWHAGEARLASTLSFSMPRRNKRAFHRDTQCGEKETAQTAQTPIVRHCRIAGSIHRLFWTQKGQQHKPSVYSVGCRRKGLMWRECTVVMEVCVSGASFFCLCELYHWINQLAIML